MNVSRTEKARFECPKNGHSEFEQLYHEARQRDPHERAAFLEQACAGDSGLRHDVESLLAEDSGVRSFLETPVLEFVKNLSSEDSGQSMVGRQFGPYSVVSFLAKGGMGEAYRARDTQLQRDVALKLLPGIFASDSERLARFQRGLCPSPPRFNAFMPVRKLWKEKTESIDKLRFPPFS